MGRELERERVACDSIGRASIIRNLFICFASQEYFDNQHEVVILKKIKTRTYKKSGLPCLQYMSWIRSGPLNKTYWDRANFDPLYSSKSACIFICFHTVHTPVFAQRE